MNAERRKIDFVLHINAKSVQTQSVRVAVEGQTVLLWPE